MALAHDLPLLQQWRESICRYCIGVPARSTFVIFPYRPWDYPALLVHAPLPLALGALHGACQREREGRSPPDGFLAGTKWLWWLYLLGSFEVTVTSVSLPPFVSRRGLSNTNQRLSLDHSGQ